MLFVCDSTQHPAMTTKATEGYVDLAELPLEFDLCSIETLQFVAAANTMHIYDLKC